MNGEAFTRGFFQELEKIALGMGVGPTPTQAMQPPPILAAVRGRRPKPQQPMATPTVKPLPMITPVPTPVG